MGDELIRQIVAALAEANVTTATSDLYLADDDEEQDAVYANSSAASPIVARRHLLESTAASLPPARRHLLSSYHLRKPADTKCQCFRIGKAAPRCVLKSPQTALPGTLQIRNFQPEAKAILSKVNGRVRLSFQKNNAFWVWQKRGSRTCRCGISVACTGHLSRDPFALCSPCASCTEYLSPCVHHFAHRFKRKKVRCRCKKKKQWMKKVRPPSNTFPPQAFHWAKCKRGSTGCTRQFGCICNKISALIFQPWRCIAPPPPPPAPPSPPQCVCTSPEVGCKSGSTTIPPHRCFASPKSCYSFSESGFASKCYVTAEEQRDCVDPEGRLPRRSTAYSGAYYIKSCPAGQGVTFKGCECASQQSGCKTGDANVPGDRCFATPQCYQVGTRRAKCYLKDFCLLPHPRGVTTPSRTSNPRGGYVRDCPAGLQVNTVGERKSATGTKCDADYLAFEKVNEINPSGFCPAVKACPMEAPFCHRELEQPEGVCDTIPMAEDSREALDPYRPLKPALNSNGRMCLDDCHCASVFGAGRCEGARDVDREDDAERTVCPPSELNVRCTPRPFACISHVDGSTHAHSTARALTCDDQ